MQSTRPDFMEPLPKRRKVSRPVYTLRVRVFENNQEAVLSHYSEPELASIKHVVSEMFKVPFGEDTKVFFSTDLVDLEDSDEGYGSDMVVTCFADVGLQEPIRTPIPMDWLKRTIRLGARNTEKDYRLIGDKIPVTLPQWGFSPWGEDMRVQFVDLEGV
jgi:hypothetical protein